MSNDEIDFLDGLESEPAPKAKVAPVAPVVSPAPVPLRSFLEFAGVGLISAALSMGLVVWKLGPRDSSPSPEAFDSRFVPIGKAYLADLGVAYGSAMEDGAKILDAGQTIDMAQGATAKAWEANRKSAFNKRITPELNRVVEQGKDEKSVTSEERSAYAKAYRGLAKGLSNQ